MIDEPTLELLSRYLDGDLPDAERADLERRIGVDASLATALSDLRQLQHQVAELAGRMESPATLDALLEPLRRGVPQASPRGRPLVRWLAVAATTVLGVAVAVEVVRHHPTDEPPQPTRPPATARPSEPGIFQLRPLPTSRIPPEQAPLGAADHLLARPLPEPGLAEPAPLDIMGPLPTPPEGESGIAESPPALAATPTAHLTLRTPGGARTIGVALAAELPSGRHRVRLEVAGGEVVGVEKRLPGQPSSAQITAALAGVHLELPDGSYPAELAVEPTNLR